MEQTIHRVRDIISTLFNVDEQTIDAESSNSTISGWDSMGQLMLILELEQQFNIEIPPEESEKLTNVAAIVLLIDRYA
jgi:acyl carrier protein